MLGHPQKMVCWFASLVSFASTQAWAARAITTVWFVFGGQKPEVAHLLWYSPRFPGPARPLS